MDKHIKLLGVIFIISILMLTGCSKSSSAVDMSTYRLEFNSNIFREIDAELVYKIEYSLGGMDDVTVSDDAKIKEIISLFKNFDLTEKAPQEEIREGGTIVRITTSNGIVSFAMFGSEILGNGRYYAINEKIGNEADDLFKQLWTEHIREQKIKFSGSIFKNLDINSVYEITYDIGGGSDFIVSDKASISDIINLFKELDIEEGIMTDEMKEGSSMVNIKTSDGVISFGMLSSEFVSDWKVYGIKEDKGGDIMEYFRQLMEK